MSNTRIIENSTRCLDDDKQFGYTGSSGSDISNHTIECEIQESSNRINSCDQPPEDANKLNKNLSTQSVSSSIHNDDKGFYPFKSEKRFGKSFRMRLNSVGSQHDYAKNFFFDILEKNKSKIISTLQVISLKYDDINKKYNYFSMVVLVLSAVITMLNSISLILTDYIKKMSENNILIHFDMVSEFIVLCLGTILTILTSIIRFRNYRETIDKLKELEEKLITLKALYINEQNNIMLYMDDNKYMKEVLPNSVESLNNDFNTINIMAFMTNDDIIKYNMRLSEIESKLSQFNPRL